MGKKTFLYKIKKVSASMLATVMVLTALPLGEMTTLASTSLQPNTSLHPTAPTDDVGVVDDYTFGSSDSTAYAFGNAHGRDGDPMEREKNFGNSSFNFAGIIKEEHRSSEYKGYLESGQGIDDVPTLPTAYGNAWWHGYYAFGKPKFISNNTDGNNLVEYDARSKIDLTNGYSANGRPLNSKNPNFNRGEIKVLSTEPGGPGTNAKNGQVYTLSAPSGQIVELRQEVKPSQDKQYILVQYTALNKSGQEVDFMVGHETDTLLGNQDAVPIYITKHGERNATYEGMHFHNNGTARYYDHLHFAIFDVFTTKIDNGRLVAGMEKRDATDPSETRVRAGKWQFEHRLGSWDYHRHFVFSQSQPGYINPRDSAAAFSAYFNLLPNERKTATFAIAIKPMVLYVKQGSRNAASNADTGFMGKPINSVKEAVAKIKKNLNTGDEISKAYIYLQGDVEINETIDIPAGLDITIQSADFTDAPGGPDDTWKRDLATVNSSTFTIKRAANFNGPMFRLADHSNENSRLTFLDVKVDGGNVEQEHPIVYAEKGTVIVKQKTTIQNNIVTKENTASAIGLAGKAVLRLDAPVDEVNIANNISKSNGSAIMVNSTASHPIVLNGKVNVINNKNLANGTDTTNPNGKANVSLGRSALWVEKGGRFTGEIGVSVDSDQLPKENNQAVKVADFDGAESTPQAIAPFATYQFTADIDAHEIQEGIPTDKEYPIVTTEKNQVPKVIYLRAPLVAFTVAYLNEEGEVIPFADLNVNSQSLTKNPIPITVAADSKVEYPLPEYNGYIYDKASGVTAGSTVINTNGSLTGKVPNETTYIRIFYKRNEVRYKFDTRGGGTIQDKVESVGNNPSTLGDIPTPVRSGFVFKHWIQYQDNVNHPNNTLNVYDEGIDTDIGSFREGETTFPVATAPGTTLLYAVWEPGPDLYFVTTTHRNTNNRLQLNFGSDANGYQITKTVTKYPFGSTGITDLQDENTGMPITQLPEIPGYQYHTASRTPSTVGEINAANGRFYIPSMPSRGVNLNYRYQVDTNKTFSITVEHFNESQTTQLKAADVLTQNAEQRFEIAPSEIAGFEYLRHNITEGMVSNSSEYTIGLEYQNEDGANVLLTQNDAQSGVVKGFMPNQNVVIRYIYKSDSTSGVVRRFYDGSSREVLASHIDNSIAPGNGIQLPFVPTDAVFDGKLYGYLWDGASTANVHPADGSIQVDGTGTLRGTMPLIGGVRADYRLSKDLSKWRRIRFALTDDSTLTGRIEENPNAPTLVLAKDTNVVGHESAYHVGKLKTLGYIPNVSATSQYYMFDDWYLDAQGTTKATDTMQFETGADDIVLYAKFVEDPSKWVDIQFVAGTNGRLWKAGDSRPNPREAIQHTEPPILLHVEYDKTWQEIAALRPTPIAIVNHEFKNWTSEAGETMEDVSTIQNGALYRANFKKIAEVWGTNVGAITPFGRIGTNGSGEIHIDGTTPENVYIISDSNGVIIAVVNGDNIGNLTMVSNITPGAHYRVQEGTPDTMAVVGGHVDEVIGTAISTPKEVYVPTVENNYAIGYDANNEGKAQIIINPADVNADYALIDESGNVVSYPGSDNGWVTPTGSNPSTVVFNNLNPNETYTVVARKKGDISIPDPKSKVADGNVITANPGDMVEATNYTIETIFGEIQTVGAQTVYGSSYTEGKAGDVIVIHAEPINAQNKSFLYWEVLSGRTSDITGRIAQTDVTFRLSNSNLVLKAVYKPTKIEADDADVREMIRGGDVGEFGLHPSRLPELAKELTTEDDRILNSVNGANVEYKVIFNKRKAKTQERDVLMTLSDSGNLHTDAYTTAYGLDLELERYVDGRMVERATGSNASVQVVAQLPVADADQLDYQLFDVTDINNPIDMGIDAQNLEKNAGLLKFEGNLNHSYVLVYSKAFKVAFINNMPVLDHTDLNNVAFNFYHTFKVRRKESLNNGYYDANYAFLNDYVANRLTQPEFKSMFEDIYGVEYNFDTWSKKENRSDVFDAGSEITKKMVIYAYYRNNQKEVLEKRAELGDVIANAQELMTDPYLKLANVQEIKAAVQKAQETLRQARDLTSVDGSNYLRQANYAELQQEIDALLALLQRLKGLSDNRKNERIAITGGASGGGTGSSGRGSKLLNPGEKSAVGAAKLESGFVKSFVLGVDGNWQINPMTKGWSFVLNGGLPLNQKWGKIDVVNKDGKKISRWYYFDQKSTMATGWLFESGHWYYMNTNPGAEQGQMVTEWVLDHQTNKWYYMDATSGVMKTGWHLDPDDGRWYYFDKDGAMLVGWQIIDGKEYYFNENTPQNTYVWNERELKWDYLNNNVRPYGSMYANEKTPSGSMVDRSGVLIK